MKRIHTLFLVFSLFSAVCYAGDQHNDTQGHKVIYVLTDSSGNPVSGQTVNLTVQRASDGTYLDFSDNTFKSSGWTTINQSMSYDATGGFYWRVLTVDNSTLFSSDYVCIVSNDDATYGDQQAEVIHWDITNNLIKINH